MTSLLESRPIRSQNYAPECSPNREIQLDSTRAQSWLSFLQTAQAGHAFLSPFIEQLDEACWLAAWKREYVIFDVDLAEIPVVLSSIAAIDAAQNFEVQEDILKCLSTL
jgi:hypothetical protein